MRIFSLSRPALIVVLVLTAGCSSNTDKLEATTWTSLATNFKGKERPANFQILQFLKDGHLVFTVAGKSYKGHYALGMGPAVTFTLDEDLHGRKIHPYKVVVEDDQLTMTSADGTDLKFQRINFLPAPPPKNPE